MSHQHSAVVRGSRSGTGNLLDRCVFETLEQRRLLAGDGLSGAYFDNMDLTSLKLTRTDATVNFDWGGSTPDASVGADTFSVRWTGQVQAQYSETYTFYTSTDDGVRLWVNGVQLVNKWTDQSPTEWSGSIALLAGQKYDITLEYYENGWGATAMLFWSSPSQAKQIIPQASLYSSVSVPEPPPTPPPPASSNGLLGQYFDNMDLTNLKVTRTDTTVNFNWGTGSPDPSIGPDTFSVRWTGQVQPLYSQTYTFYTSTDDGVRLWVNGVKLIDKWKDQSPSELKGTIALAAGQKYDIKLEYFENGWGASAVLKWSSGKQAKQVIPNSQLFSSAVVPAPARSAYGVIEAESYDQGSGTQKNSTDISALDNGDWVKFASVDFETGLASVAVRLAVPASNSGGSIEFRADSATGTLLGTLVVQTTGSYTTFYTQKVNLNAITGVHDMYLVFRNNSTMAVVDNLQFSKTRLTRIMPLGDSITQGASNSANYRYYLWQSLQTGGYAADFVGSMTKTWNGTGEPPYYDFDQNNEGHSGYSSAQILSGVTSWATASQPDVVLLHAGTNDIRSGVSASTVINNIGQIIDRLRAVNPNVIVLVAQIIPSVGYEVATQSFNSLIPAMVSSKTTAQSRILAVDQFTGFNATTDTWDGIHPTSAGDLKMANKLCAVLQTVL